MLPIRDGFAKLMADKMNYLHSKGIIYSKDPLTVSAFVLQSATSKCKGENAAFYPTANVLAAMARAMQALLELSISSFLTQLKNMQGESKPGFNSLTNSHAFLDMVRRTEHLVRSPGFVPHPKMDRLRTLVLEHFAGHEDATGGSTRVMVFCTLRNVVEEIVSFLNVQKPLIRATRFVGQSNDAQGKKGTTQKEQMEVRERSAESSADDADDQAVQARRLQRPRGHVDRRGGPRHWRGRSDRLLRDVQVADPHGPPLRS